MMLRNPFRHRHKAWQVHLYTDKEAILTGWCPCRPLIATTFSGVATVKVFTNAQRGADGTPPTSEEAPDDPTA